MLRVSSQTNPQRVPLLRHDCSLSGFGMTSALIKKALHAQAAWPDFPLSNRHPPSHRDFHIRNKRNRCAPTRLRTAGPLETSSPVTLDLSEQLPFHCVVRLTKSISNSGSSSKLPCKSAAATCKMRGKSDSGDPLRRPSPDIYPHSAIYFPGRDTTYKGFSKILHDLSSWSHSCSWAVIVSLLYVLARSKSSSTTLSGRFPSAGAIIKFLALRSSCATKAAVINLIASTNLAIRSFEKVSRCNCFSPGIYSMNSALGRSVSFKNISRCGCQSFGRSPSKTRNVALFRHPLLL